MARTSPTSQAIGTGSDTVNGASRVAGAGAGAKVVGSRVPQAAALLGEAAGTAGRVVSGLARFSAPLMAANAVGGALKGGHAAYEKGGSAGDVAKGAAWGAADQVTVGLASWAYGKGAELGAAHAAGFSGKGPASDAPQYDAMGNVTGGAPEPKPVQVAGGFADKVDSALRKVPAYNKVATEMDAKGKQTRGERFGELVKKDIPHAAATGIAIVAPKAYAAGAAGHAVVGDTLSDKLPNRDRAEIANRVTGGKAALPGMMKLGGPGGGAASGSKSVSDMSNAELHERSVQSSLEGMKAGGGYHDDRDVHNEIAKRIHDGRMTPKEQEDHRRDWGKRVMPNSVDPQGNWKPGEAERAVTRERQRQQMPLPQPRSDGPRPEGVRPQSSLTPQQTQAFRQANAHFQDSHLTGATEKQPPTYGPNGNGKRGFQIAKVQAAAQAAKGNQYDGPDED